jgi:hypothetical protein
MLSSNNSGSKRSNTIQPKKAGCGCGAGKH